MTLQAFKAQLAIVRDVARFQATHLQRSGSDRLSHEVRISVLICVRNGSKTRMLCPLKADVKAGAEVGRKGPVPDSCIATNKRLLFNHLVGRGK
jgi:hypothetical protein